jgi:hypothetical protein
MTTSPKPGTGSFGELFFDKHNRLNLGSFPR